MLILLLTHSRRFFHRFINQSPFRSSLEENER
jgi:hypothetical protein